MTLVREAECTLHGVWVLDRHECVDGRQEPVEDVSGVVNTGSPVHQPPSLAGVRTRHIVVEDEE